MSQGFDMKVEIAKLSRRILEPVAANVRAEELENAVGRIRYAFEELSTSGTTADTNFKVTAANILEPIRPTLTKTDFARIVDRLRGAMAGFCQADRDQSAA